MALYKDLPLVLEDGIFINRVRIACLVAANLIQKNPVSDAEAQKARMAWARSAFASPVGVADQVARYVVSEFNMLTVAGIQGADDASLQAAVNTAVGILAVPV